MDYKNNKPFEREDEAVTRIKKLAAELNKMRNLLYEIKADTPLGITVITLLNIFVEGREGNLALTGISYDKLACSMGISPRELLDSLEYLHQQGIIYYKFASVERK